MPPTFVQEAETAWNTTTSPKATAGFDVLSNDLLVGCAANNDSANPTSIIDIYDDHSLTWTSRQEILWPDAIVEIKTAPVTSDIVGLITSFERDGASATFGGNALTFRGTGGVGASNQTTGTGAPSLSLTTTADNSSIAVIVADTAYVDGSSRTWRTGAGALTELTYVRVSLKYTVYVGYHEDAGAAGAKTVGLTAPVGQTYGIVALEVLMGSEPIVPEQTDIIKTVLSR